MRREIFTFFCFGLMLFGSFFVREAKAAILTVTDASDSTVGAAGCSDGCSLREAISAAAANDEIRFSTLFNSSQTITLSGSEITINKALTITGPGANLLTIDGGAGANRIFYKSTLSDVAITGVTMQNGNGEGQGADDGGAISILQGKLTLDKVQFQNNSARSGGAILSNGRLFITNSTFNNNSASGAGGAVVTNFNTVIEVTNSTFSGNSCASSNGEGGGALYVSGSSSAIFRSVTITGNNSGSGRGGGIYNWSTTNSVQVNNSIIAGNSAASNPETFGLINDGGFNMFGGNPQLAPLAYNGGTTRTRALNSNSPAIDAGNPNNAAVPPTDQRGAPRPGNNRSDIGAFEFQHYIVTTDANSGGGSLRAGIANNELYGPGIISFDPTFFASPRTISLGGAVLDIFKDLTINGPGAANITIDGENLSRIFNIDGPTLNLSGVRLTRGFPGMNNSGGAILVNGNATLNASNITIDNSRAYYGGGIHVVGTLNLSSSTISNCTADYAGGAFFNNSNTSTVGSSNITNNHAETLGGGVGNSGILTIRNTTISGNTATRPPGSGDTPLGGGIYNDGNLALFDSTLAGNSAQLGGGLFNRKAFRDGYSDIRNSTIVGNSAIQTGNGPTPDGGAIYADSDHTGGITSTVDAINVTLYGNSAVSSGGGIFMNQYSGNNPVFNLHNSIIAGNTAANAPDMSGRITSYGYNLITDPNGSNWSPSSPSLEGNIFNPPGGARLAPLGNYGGLTQTMPPLPNSPAINAGNPNNLFGSDQRGSLRPIGGRADIGAFERNVVFNQTSLPNGHQNSSYNQQLSASRLTNFAETEKLPSNESLAPTQFAVVPVAGQTLPPGVSLSPTGLLSGTPTTQGNFIFTVKATDPADGIAGVQQLSLQILAPTAASVSVSGRILTVTGGGVRNARVILTDSGGNSRTVLTGSFGYYRFDGVAVGEIYIVSVVSKRFVFAPQAISVTDDVTELNFTANE